eukprot:jgi/Psemu1/64530/estExt_Genemark1.C_690003
MAPRKTSASKGDSNDRDAKKKKTMQVLTVFSFKEFEDGDEPDKLTKEQVDTLRYVIITKNRDKQIDEMEEYILGEQAGSDMLSFTTSFSYDVLDGFDYFQSKMYKNKSKQRKFDMLFAYTYQLKEHDVWMHDNEGGMNDMVEDLAKMWKELLKNSDKSLGIDSEYTRPGVLQLLEDFKEEIESHCAEPPFEFRFK